MIYHIEFQDGSKKTIKADGFKISWDSVFVFFSESDGHSSNAKLYVPFTSVKVLEPMDETSYKELAMAETQAAREMRRTTNEK